MWRRWLRDTHWPLVASVVGLLGVGTLFIYSGAYHTPTDYLSRQALWVSVGLVLLFLLPFIGYRTFLSLSYIFYAFSMVLLLAVMVIGESRLGAQRWISIGPIALQPSELVKITTILALANFLGFHYPWERSARVLWGALGLAALPLLLIVKQPDLGTSILFIPLVAAILFFWGVRIRAFVMTGLAGILAMPLFWTFLKPYQQKRILVFLDPARDPLGAGYTAIQSKIAVGSGGWFGKGYLHGTQSQLNFVPEHHTDFIFCVIGEEWGFAGALLVLGLYALLFRSLFQIMENTTDLKARLLIAGICAVLFSQVFVNIGMSIGMMPITGLTLPLISYGGSSLVTTALALGLVLSVYKERSIF